MFKLGLIFCIGSILICSSWSQNDTTTIGYNNTDSGNTTTFTVTSTVPTTSLPTTTTIRPSVPGTTIPANVDVSKCPCDLTGNACDIGCCCDPDCSDADKAVFTPCQPFSYVLDDKLCFDRNVFFLENGPAQSGDSGDLFCIYFDNDEKRNYYINPSLVTTEAEFLSYAAKHRKFSFQSVVPSNSVRNFNPFYKRGDPIYVVFPDNAFSFLALPAAVATSPLCTDSNPAAYLIDQSNTCARTLSNLPEECNNNTALRASTFYEGFRIIRDTFLLKEFNSSSRIQHPILGLVDLTSITSLYNNSYTVALSLDPDNPLQCVKNGVAGNCSFTEPPTAPVYDVATRTCQNALVGVRYRFGTNGTLGIDSAFVSFIFSDVGSPNVAQTFSTTFTTVSSAGERIQRSGHPGYQVGQPIMAGVLNVTTQGATTSERILLQQARGQQLALIRGSVSGDCMTDLGQLREPVLFGQDMRTGCFIQVNETSEAEVCKMLQELIVRVVEGYSLPAYDTTLNIYPKSNLYVAMFGDSEVNRTGDWVEVLYKNRPDPSKTVGTQCLLPLGANLQILYANVGSLPNPQAKIIGVAYVYDEPQEVRYKCSGPFCQPGTSMSQKIEISSSVAFIDVSQPPVAVEGVYPTTAARLPYDFFYPFLSGAPGSLRAGHLCWFLCLVCVLNMLRHRWLV